MSKCVSASRVLWIWSDTSLGENLSDWHKIYNFMKKETKTSFCGDAFLISWLHNVHLDSGGTPRAKAPLTAVFLQNTWRCHAVCVMKRDCGALSGFLLHIHILFKGSIRCVKAKNLQMAKWKGYHNGALSLSETEDQGSGGFSCQLHTVRTKCSSRSSCSNMWQLFVVVFLNGAEQQADSCVDSNETEGSLSKGMRT